MLKPATERIGQQLFRQCLNEGVWTCHKRCAQFPHAVHLPAVGQSARSIDRGAGFVRPPRADGVEAFERETERID
ncbi:hypothetical protein D3C83_132480 [compost metagenome]